MKFAEDLMSRIYNGDKTALDELVAGGILTRKDANRIIHDFKEERDHLLAMSRSLGKAAAETTENILKEALE